MHSIKSVGILSFAKMMGAVYGALGLIVIPIVIVAGLISMASGEREGALAGIGFLALGILAPIFYGGMGFLMGALMAWVYNLMAKWVGGIQIELRPLSPRNPAASQFGLI